MALSQKRKVSDRRKTRKTKTPITEKDAKIIASTSKETTSSKRRYYLRSSSTNSAKGSIKKQNKQHLQPKGPQRKLNYSVKNTSRVKRASPPKVVVKRLKRSYVCKVHKSVKDLDRSRRTVLKISRSKPVGKKRPEPASVGKKSAKPVRNNTNSSKPVRNNTNSSKPVRNNTNSSKPVRKKNTASQLGRGRTSDRQVPVAGQSTAVLSGESLSRINRTLNKTVPSSSSNMAGRQTRQMISRTDSSGKRTLPSDKSPTTSAAKSSVGNRTSNDTSFTSTSKPVSRTLKRTLPFNSIPTTYVKPSKVTRCHQTLDKNVLVIVSSSRTTDPADCGNIGELPSLVSSKASSAKKSRKEQTVVGPSSSNSTHSRTASSTGSKKLQSNSTSNNQLPGPAVASTSSSVTRRSQKTDVAPSSVCTPKRTKQGRLTGDEASASSFNSTSPRPARQSPPVRTQSISPPTINYQYPKLADLPKHIPVDPASAMLKKAEERVNVYGVVEYFKPPTRTSGINYIMVVVLSDESFQQVGFRCCLFGISPEVLPKVTSVGDVLRLHRIKLVKHGGTIYGQSCPGWSGLVFPKNGDPPISTTQNFTLTDKDHRKVAKLRKLAPSLSLVPTIENIRHGTYVDISCQVVAVKIINNERAALRVWDGTKLSSGCQTYGVHEDDIPQDLQDASNGFTVDVLVFDEHRTKAGSLKSGDLIKLVNVTADHGRMNPDDFGLIMRGGSSYGRGIEILDRGSCDFQMLETRLNRLKNADSDDV